MLSGGRALNHPSASLKENCGVRGMREGGGEGEEREGGKEGGNLCL